MDKLIKYDHAIKLAKINEESSYLVLVDDMTHGEFRYYNDLCHHINIFLKKLRKKNL
jgi:hypothetical protein